MAELVEIPRRGGAIHLSERPSDESPPDWRERERAMDVRASWIVEAPAGSGKTGLLIQRFLKLLASSDVERPEQVLAITFTKAATEEIRARVISHLEGASAGTKTDGAFDKLTRDLAQAVLRRDAEMGWRLLDSPRRLNLRTIDSVCAEIARALPVTSGGNAGVTPVEQPEAMYREAGRRTLLHLGGGDSLLSDALRTMLLHRDGNVSDCETLIAEMLEAREQWGDLVPIGREELNEDWLEGQVRSRLDRALELQVCRGLGDLSRAIPATVLDELTQLGAQMADAPGRMNGPSPMAICSGVTIAPGERIEHMEHWQALINLLVKSDGDWRAQFQTRWLHFEWDKRHTRPMMALIATLQEEEGAKEAIEQFNRLPPPRYPEEQWLVAKALFRVLSRALAELQLVFAERGGCDFTESALLARTALRREGGVEGYESTMGMELRHLLVDEVQDTSNGQYELIELLTQGWESEGKTVFLVGDPKQSIYLFRQARVERFVATMQTERMGELRLGRLRLTANFRSQAGLVESFNDDFGRIFPAGRRIEDVPFVAAQAVRPAASGDSREHGRAWHALRATGTRQETGDLKRAVARRNAKKIRAIAERWRARPLPKGRSGGWKVAVLVRSRRELREIVAAFKEDGIKGGPLPYRAVKVEPLKDRREVLDLLALTRALKHPADRVAWWAVLRAPWCALNLADLHVLAGEDDQSLSECTVMDLIKTRGDLLQPESIQRLERVWPVLAAAMERRSRVRMPELVERTWRSLGGDAPLRALELANATRYLELLDELDRETGSVELRELDRKMQKLFAAPGNDAGAVDLMTIHGAKGLEWDVVFVPELERKAPPSRNRLLEWEEIANTGDESAAQIVLAPIAGRGEQSKALNKWLRGIRSGREAAERRRLFYVACTRAREELHLFGTGNVLKDGSVKAESGSLLEAAWPAAMTRFQGQAEVLAKPAQMPLFGLALAAAAESEGDDAKPVMVERLPSGFDPMIRLAGHLPPAANAAVEVRSRFDRPEGSFAARSFGNAVHAFMEVAARRLAAGLGVAELAKEVQEWRGRAAAMLRADGLPPAEVERLAGRVVFALLNTLREPVGRWLLGARIDGRSEFALTMAGSYAGKLRMDRMFRAGPQPETEGSDCLWIIDYKSGAHGSEGVEAFLNNERAKYAGQMEAYARASGVAEARLGLWYPMIGRLKWWAAGD